MKNAMLPCFVCNTTLRNALPDTQNQPYAATEFHTYGHYGSTFWDNFDGVALVLNICDECLTKGSDRLATRGRAHRVDPPMRTYNPPKET